MKKVHVFIAMSLDGYIADRNGKVEWLQGQQENQNDMQSYEQFIQCIDTVIMGWTTYHQIVSELMEDTWCYKGLTTYVLTHREMQDCEDIHFVHEDAAALVKRLKKQTGNDIWICGGANVIEQLRKADMIDRYHISILPILLGEGISLFSPIANSQPLQLIDTFSYNGIVDVIYERRE